MTTEKVEEKAAEAGAEVPEEESKALRGAKIIRNYSLVTAGAGFIPLPLADVTVIAGVQLKLLHSLAKLYEVPFTSNLGKSLIAALTGGVASDGIARGTLGSLVKAVPIVGSVAGMLTLPAIAGATTYAVGKVFLQHFESGGTFLDFDPDKVKEYFAEQIEKGKLVVGGAKK